MRAALLGLGYDVPPSEANFVWLPLGDGHGEWADGCADRKLIVRPFAGDGVRVTIGTATRTTGCSRPPRELVALGRAATISSGLICANGLVDIPKRRTTALSRYLPLPGCLRVRYLTVYSADGRWRLA